MGKRKKERFVRLYRIMGRFWIQCANSNCNISYYMHKFHVGRKGIGFWRNSRMKIHDGPSDKSEPYHYIDNTLIWKWYEQVKLSQKSISKKWHKCKGCKVTYYCSRKCQK